MGVRRAGVRRALGRWSAAAAVAGVLLLLVGPAWARSYRFERVAIDATVTPDGHMNVVEARTYRFDGAFSWATYELPLAGATDIRDIRVADDDGPYARAATGAPRTFSVSRDAATVEIRWHFSARDEARTFTLAYRLDDVVVVYDDVAELYWKFVGTGWEAVSRLVTVDVRLPGALPASAIRVWGHGPLHGRATPRDGGARLEVRDLPASTMVEGRVVFPRAAVPNARVVRPGPALPRILAEEGRWARHANLRRAAQRAVLYGGLALPLVVLGLWIRLYLRYGREPRPAWEGDYYRELPGSYPPAALGVLWRFGTVVSADFAATALDLARRGYVGIERASDGRDDAYVLTRTGRAGGLAPFERQALELLFGHADGPASPVRLQARGGLPAEVRRRVGQGFSAWTAAVRAAARAHGFFDDASARVSGASLAGGVLLLLGAWFGGGMLVEIDAFGWLPMVGLGVAGVMLLAGGGALRRRSQRGADDLARWQAFRRFLLHFSEMPRAELPSLALWEHYLVYAVPLGVADQVVRQLGKVYPAEELARAPGLRVWAGGPSSRGAGLASLGAFTTALSVATSAASSSSGRGGGFSGGGGGGGGGSGGRAG